MIEHRIHDNDGDMLEVESMTNVSGIYIRVNQDSYHPITPGHGTVRLTREQAGGLAAVLARVSNPNTPDDDRPEAGDAPSPAHYESQSAFEGGVVVNVYVNLPNREDSPDA